MGRGTVVLAALCAAVCAVSAVPLGQIPMGPSASVKYWVQAEAAFSREEFSLYDVRDSYRGVNLAVLTSAEIEAVKESRSVMILAKYLGEEQYVYILSHADPEVEWQTKAREVTVANKGTIVLDKDETIVVVYDTLIRHCIYPPHVVEVVPVARQARSLPPLRTQSFAYSLGHNAQYRRDVQDLVSDVSTEAMQSTISRLSEDIYSRQASSQGAYEGMEWIAEQYTALGLNVTIFDFDDRYAPNVIATIPGSGEPERFLYLGAHFDSRGRNSRDEDERAPGADDNGSGTAALLEIARVFMDAGASFRYSVVFCAWGAEELGLIGSAAYVKYLKENDVDVIANLNADMLGYKLPDTPITLGMKGPYASADLTEALNEITSLYVPELPIGSSDSCCSDFKSFSDQGYEAAGYFEHIKGASAYPDYHTPEDEITNIDFEQQTLHTKAMLAGAAVLGGILE